MVIRCRILQITNFVDDTVSILLGIGNGKFENPATIDVGLDPFSVAIGDFNGDTMSDLADH